VRLLFPDAPRLTTALSPSSDALCLRARLSSAHVADPTTDDSVHLPLPACVFWCGAAHAATCAAFLGYPAA
jgi:hypothetical protein